MRSLADIQSQLRMLGLFPVLLVLSGLYFTRGDRLWQAMWRRPARYPASSVTGCTVIQLDRERARRNRTTR